MKVLTLERFGDTPYGVFGTMLVNGVELYTVERPWIDNRPSISCIPWGSFTCRQRQYYKGGYKTFEVTEVPNRSHILIHKGNTDQDVRGCIALGTDLGFVRGRWAVVNSRGAFNLFWKEVKHLSEFTLDITGKER